MVAAGLLTVRALVVPTLMLSPLSSKTPVEEMVKRVVAPCFDGKLIVTRGFHQRECAAVTAAHQVETGVLHCLDVNRCCCRGGQDLQRTIGCARSY